MQITVNPLSTAVPLVLSTTTLTDVVLAVDTSALIAPLFNVLHGLAVHPAFPLNAELMETV